MRLLRLIREGTADHAQQAAAQLTQLTLSSSPLVLWDTLGRLQAFLTASEWKTRHNASMALQGVAAHLPTSDQIHFLQANYQSGDCLYLTVQELSESMETVLEQGRLLLAASDTKYDAREEQELRQLDQMRANDQDFVQQRIRLQRRILAQRLGLEGIQTIVGDDALCDTITSEDIVSEEPTVKRSKLVKRYQKRNESDEQEHSVRALLVMEIDQQRNKSSSAGAVSHQSPQNLLATELIYRMFDASWTVRHGALLGTLSLLRAWKAQAPNTEFGSWPHDILARCLCVVALDRLGDFSETMASSNTRGGVVAPVRETAGQLLSVLLIMAPPAIQKDAMKILFQLCRYTPEWEVRHGALVALKFVVVIVQSDIIQQENTCQDDSALSIDDIARIAIEHLLDESDDVKSVAAQILVEIVSRPEQLPSIVWEAPPNLWASLHAADSVSSCIPDLFTLFTSFLSHDSTKLLRLLWDTTHEKTPPGSIMRSIVPFLDSDFQSVRRCALRSIGVITRPVCQALLSALSKETKEEAVEIYCSIVERLYSMYFDEGGDSFESLRTDAWNQVTRIAEDVFVQADKARKMFQTRLVCIYFGVKARRKRGDEQFHCHCLAADALSAFLLNAGRLDDIYPMLHFALGSFIGSPWCLQVEAACILYQGLSRHSLAVSALGPFHSSMVELLQSTPFCLSLGVEYSGFESNALISLCDEAFLQGLEMLADGESEAESACRVVTELWVRSVHSSGLNPSPSAENTANENSMRVRASIAGAVVVGGLLPSKITPVVRALMTSLKNESCASRQRHTCESFTRLVRVMDSNQAHSAARCKILNTICDMIESDGDDTENNALGQSPAARVIQSIIETLPCDKTLKSLPPVWSRVEVLSSRDAVSTDESKLLGSMSLLCATCGGLTKDSAMTLFLVDAFIPILVQIACEHTLAEARCVSASAVKRLCLVDSRRGLRQALGTMKGYLKDRQNDSYRQSACQLLKALVEEVGMDACPFVRYLLPVVMSLMTDPIVECSRIANNVFACLVRIAPLVNFDTSVAIDASDVHIDSVIDHLILGKPLPPCTLPTKIKAALDQGGIVLRNYQKEGVAWLCFLQTVNLNGALCDSMGVGKTLQALIAVGISHHDEKGLGRESKAVSLVVCPATLVGHWIAEIDKAFPDGSVFRPLSLVGSRSVRQSLWRTGLPHCNIVVTSYAVLRSDVDFLAHIDWHFCILDEGHLLKNPKTGKVAYTRLLALSS